MANMRLNSKGNAAGDSNPSDTGRERHVSYE
jgi:hypothetical protein